MKRAIRGNPPYIVTPIAFLTVIHREHGVGSQFGAREHGYQLIIRTSSLWMFRNSMAIVENILG